MARKKGKRGRSRKVESLAAQLRQETQSQMAGVNYQHLLQTQSNVAVDVSVTDADDQYVEPAPEVARPNGVSDEVLLDEWLRLHTPRASVNVRKDKRVWHGGNPLRRKAVSLSDVKAHFNGYRTVDLKTYMGAMAQSQVSRYWSEPGHNVEEMRNTKASSYILDSFKLHAEAIRGIERCFNKKYMKLHDELRENREKSNVVSFADAMQSRWEEKEDLEAIKAAEAMDVTGATYRDQEMADAAPPWDDEPSVSVAEALDNVAEIAGIDEQVRQTDVDPGELRSKYLFHMEQKKVCIRRSKSVSDSERVVLAKQEMYHHYEAMAFLQEYHDTLGDVKLGKARAMRASRLKKLCAIRRSVTKVAIAKKFSPVRKVVTHSAEACSRIYEGIMRSHELAKEAIKVKYDAAVLSVFGQDFVPRESGILIPAAVAEFEDRTGRIEPTFGGELIA